MKASALKHYLKQPYPYFYEIKNVIYIAILIFSMTLCFNYFFEPFEVNEKEHKMIFFWISTIHAAVSFVIICLGAILLFFKKKLVNHWTVKKEGVFILLTMLLIGICQFLVRDIIYNNPDNWSWRYFYEEIRNTFLVGTLFLIIVVPLVHNRFLKQNRKTVKHILPIVNKQANHLDEEITIISTLKSDQFRLNPNRFLFAVSEGNYTEVHFLKAGKQPAKKLIRISLKNFEAQLLPYKYIMRTHRSFVVNLNQITDIEGNAQGLKLLFTDGLQKALVSRKMVTDFKKTLQHFRS